MSVNARKYIRGTATLLKITQQNLPGLKKKKKTQMIFQRPTPFKTRRRKTFSTKAHIEKILWGQGPKGLAVCSCVVIPRAILWPQNTGATICLLVAPGEPVITTQQKRLPKNPHRHQKSFPFIYHWGFVLIYYSVDQP